ncbi:MAG: hypothetical protein M3Q39_00950 [Actinomycetota bacterium]|nr:hypothetical protein [Actinomycetota bacterium]
MTGVSVRKPYNDRRGYIASLRSAANRGWVVIYEAGAAGIDADGCRYAVVCEAHGAIVGAKSMPSARGAMKAVDFCDDCRRWDTEVRENARKNLPDMVHRSAPVLVISNAAA